MAAVLLGALAASAVAVVDANADTAHVPPICTAYGGAPFVDGGSVYGVGEVRCDTRVPVIEMNVWLSVDGVEPPVFRLYVRSPNINVVTQGSNPVNCTPGKWVTHVEAWVEGNDGVQHHGTYDTLPTTLSCAPFPNV